MPESGSKPPRTPPRIGAAFDPLIALVWILVLLLATLATRQRLQQHAAAASSAGLQARILEIQAAAEDLHPLGLSLVPPRVEKKLTAPWDRAVAAVLTAERGDLDTARRLAVEDAGIPEPWKDFRACFRVAYEGAPLSENPRAQEQSAAISKALGGGRAACFLEARLRELKGDTAGAEALRRSARTQAQRQFIGLAAVGLAVVVLLIGGLGFAVFLILTRKVPPRAPLQVPAMEGRGLALVFGLWGLALLLSGSVVAVVVDAAPVVKPYGLFMAYGLHAGIGVALLAWIEGRPIAGILARLGSPAPLRSLGWGAGFLALGVLLVLLVGLLLAPMTKNSEPPQRELMELIQGSGGLLPTLLLFLAMAGLAPCFEELLFRGTLLPWLQARLGARWALPLSALAFAAIHLQPLALPTLFTLGTVLGLAARRTGGLLAPVAVHASWNGGVFLLLKLLA